MKTLFSKKPFPFNNLQAQYNCYRRGINKSLLQVARQCSFLGGDILNDFERDLSHYVGADEAIGCSSGTLALHLILMALNIGPGDEVITTSFTFIATVEVIALVGATPVFVDIEKDTYNIDIQQVKKAINKKTKAVIGVSLFGLMCKACDLQTLCDKHSIAFIEDAAQSFGATYKQQQSGSVSAYATTSFYPSKPLGGYGDGGAIFINTNLHRQAQEVANKIRAFINHGKKVGERQLHHYIGLNGRLDNLQAVVLQVKMRHFKSELEKRHSIAKRYHFQLEKQISRLGLVLPTIPKHYTSVYAQYSIQIERRDDLIEHFKEKGIPLYVFYAPPIHLQPAFAYLGYQKGDLPIAESIANKIVSLPMSAYLSNQQQNQVVAALSSFRAV